MKAIFVKEFGGIENLVVGSYSKPKVEAPRDILVRVKVSALNPVDLLQRSNFGKPGPAPGEGFILGWDAAGIVEEVGSEVKKFKVGDEVYFAGNLMRNGCHAQYTVVDERIAARKPTKLSFEEASTIPLTALTAWEGFVDGLSLKEATVSEVYSTSEKQTVLIIGGAGGVGSIAIQLAKKVFNLTVIATATRPESTEFCKKMGADFVISHNEDLGKQLEQIGIPQVNYVYNTSSTDRYLPLLPPILKPSGKVVLIVSSSAPIDIAPFMFKRISIAWEMMFSRAIFQDEPEKQGEILANVAALIDAGVLNADGRISQRFTMEQVAEAQKVQQSGTVIGKNVILID